ncbi:MAG: glycosyltransferase involved in cell wall biosynthesis, partial [Saprospiraceae bacterium]
PSLGRTVKAVKSKKVALLHNIIPHEKRFFDDAFNKYYLSQNDGFVVLSDTVKKQLLSYKPDAKFIQISHPVYSHFGEILDKNTSKNALKINPERKVILFFGFIRKYKGLDILIKALADYTDNYTLLIAGESYEEQSELDQQLIDAGINNEKLCKHIKYIPDEEVKLYFSASDVCVLPYRSATQSGIAAIAKHFEVPMVVTPVGELPNEVNHLKDGFVCRDSSPESVREGITETLSKLDEFKQNTRRDNKEHTFEKFGQKLLAFIESL